MPAITARRVVAQFFRKLILTRWERRGFILKITFAVESGKLGSMGTGQKNPVSAHGRNGKPSMPAGRYDSDQGYLDATAKASNGSTKLS
jgi:hypothetical protein